MELQCQCFECNGLMDGHDGDDTKQSPADLTVFVSP
ncbi:Heat shock factor-binding protein [Bienertia sinuspersici]